MSQLTITRHPHSSNGNYSVTVTEKGNPLVFSQNQIKWGITGEEPVPDVTGVLDPSQLTCFVYYPKSTTPTPPTTLWVFQSIDATHNPKIKRVQNTFLRALDCLVLDKKVSKYKKTLEQLKIFSSLNDKDINRFVLIVKRECFFTQMEYERDLYLTDEKEKKKFNENIEDYKEYTDPAAFFKCFLDIVKMYQAETHPASYMYLTRAITHDILDHPLLAAEAYLQLLDQLLETKNPNSAVCIEKIKLLINPEKAKKNPVFFDFLENLDRSLLVRLCDKTSDKVLKELLFQKDAIRVCFEECLTGIQSDTTRKNPTCFVCFALEKSVETWLKKTFVPDLEKAGIEPIFGPWHLSHADDLNSFQSKIRNSNLALIVCTPRLKELCTERVKAITGSVQEVRMAQERYNDADKQGTLFTLLLHGRRADCIPTPILEPIFAAKFEVANEERETDLYDYYSKGFRLFAALKGVTNSSQFADHLKEAFIKKAEAIVFNGKFDKEQVEKWRQEHFGRNFEILIRSQEALNAGSGNADFFKNSSSSNSSAIPLVSSGLTRGFQQQEGGNLDLRQTGTTFQNSSSFGPAETSSNSSSTTFSAMDLSVPDDVILPHLQDSFKMSDHFKLVTHLWKDPQATLSDAMVEKVNLVASHLKEEGFELCGIKADGDCFFNAFLGSYKSLSNTKITILDEQKNPVDYLRDWVSKIFIKKNKEQEKRSNEIKQKGQWIHSEEGDLLISALPIPMRVITVQNDEHGCGFIDMLTMNGRREWTSIPKEYRPQEYIFIIDLGGHFVYAKKKTTE